MGKVSLDVAEQTHTHLQSRGRRRVDFAALKYVQSVAEVSGISSRSPGSQSWLLRTQQPQIQSWKETWVVLGDVSSLATGVKKMFCVLSLT